MFAVSQNVNLNTVVFQLRLTIDLYLLQCCSRPGHFVPRLHKDTYTSILSAIKFK